MAFHSDNPAEMSCYNSHLEGIRKGIRTFDDVGYIKWKQALYEELLPEVNNQTASDGTIKAMSMYLAKEIKKGKMKINDVPDTLLDNVKTLVA